MTGDDGKRVGGPASGLPARGYSWPPFERGNDAALRHGSYSSVAISKRAVEITDEVRAVLPLFHPADEPALRLLGVTLARVEAASEALDQVDEMLTNRKLAAYLSGSAERFDRLRKDLRSWISTAMRLMESLGMTPASRARLGLDIALAERASEQALDRLAAEGREIRARREETL